MDLEKIEKLADYLLIAQDKHSEINKLTETHCPELTIKEAYAIQKALLEKRLARGEAIVGPKMGLTSQAKLQQMAVTDPIYGYVFDSMLVEDGGTIAINEYIHPKVEPELGFVLKEEIKGPDVTKEAVLAATDFIFPAIEIIDSRYRNFQFTLPDVIADDASAAGAVFGTSIKELGTLDLETIGVILEINGKVKEVGAGAAVLNHPAEAVARLANILAEQGKSVKPGQPILTGAMTAAVRIESGDYVEVKFGEGVGVVRLFVS
ncbi:fumarylacetoacetate hydrolase family protein [uncultured Enterococcus sp.]|uniref:2-keto-4-pentenoate hydratase n=1 Tax=uncultured Enterococcus sp. TaxID=167972 RepID=UPI002AA7C978|nr:fumarylacetoacetate hydrolase family protein [uncultured Enterococcus sp.]